MDAQERELVRASVRDLLSRSASAPAEIPARLLDEGWGELAGDDAATAVGIVAEEQGRALAAAPTLDLVLAHGADLPVDPSTGFVLPPLRRGATTSSDGSRVEGLVLAGHDRAEAFVVATGDGLRRVPAGALAFIRIGGADPDLGLHAATGEVAGAPVGDAAAWTAALAAGRRALAAELVGVGERMLAQTVEHVIGRHQFGRPIGSFQAVKHRLADVRVALTAARAGIDAAWADGDPGTAVAAKCLAGRAHRLAATHCHQVHGGIAFTVEHGFHRAIRRGQLLDSLLGAADDLAVELGQRLIDAGVVPRTPQLTLA